jgi:hypothetical protein
MVPKIGLTGATRWGETRRTMASAHGCGHPAGPNRQRKKPDGLATSSP